MHRIGTTTVRLGGDHDRRRQANALHILIEVTPEALALAAVGNEWVDQHDARCGLVVDARDLLRPATTEAVRFAGPLRVR